MKSRAIQTNSFFSRMHCQVNPFCKVPLFFFVNFIVFWGQTIVFCYNRPAQWTVCGVSFILALLFSFAVLLMLRWFSCLGRLLVSYCNRILSGFLLFFCVLLGYIILANLTVSLPMGWILEQNGFLSETIIIYSLQISNCALALAVLTWFRQLPFLIRNTTSLPFSA